MQTDLPANPDPEDHILVGQDNRGHWLVQENQGRTETHFVSRDAALRFARWERHAHAHAVIVLADRPLVSSLAG